MSPVHLKATRPRVRRAVEPDERQQLIDLAIEQGVPPEALEGLTEQQIVDGLLFGA